MWNMYKSTFKGIYDKYEMQLYPRNKQQYDKKSLFFIKRISVFLYSWRFSPHYLHLLHHTRIDYSATLILHNKYSING